MQNGEPAHNTEPTATEDDLQARIQELEAKLRAMQGGPKVDWTTTNQTEGVEATAAEAVSALDQEAWRREMAAALQAKQKEEGDWEGEEEEAWAATTPHDHHARADQRPPHHQVTPRADRPPPRRQATSSQGGRHMGGGGGGRGAHGYVDHQGYHAGAAAAATPPEGAGPQTRDHQGAAAHGTTRAMLPRPEVEMSGMSARLVTA